MKIFSLVIPVYNEKEAIFQTLQQVLRAKESIIKNTNFTNVEIIVVNDGSRDGTEEIVKQFFEIKLIDHPANYGYGAALKTGFAAAKGGVIGFQDGDGTCDPEVFVNMLKTLEDTQSDMVIGCRLSAGSEMPFVRWMGNKFYSIVISFLGNTKIKDTTSGIRVMKRHLIKNLYMLPDGLHFSPALTTQVIFEHQKITEISIPYHERLGHSKISILNDGFGFLFSIINVIRLYNPLRLFGILGLAFVITGLWLSVGLIRVYLSSELIEEWLIYRMFAILFCFSFGIMAISSGILANYIIDSRLGQISRQTIIGRFFYNPHIYERFALIGFFLMFFGFILIAPSVWQYFTIRNIYSHWSNFVFSIMLIFVGFQLVLLKYIFSIIRDVNKIGDNK